ncbi:homeobox-leucine zipper protein HOX19-like [Canna indica]|uniref:Homeobox-leucine zipper protein HOX19-like n=1 Tax=Canna indica TaxID=4628 RepID=A0AAQ3KKX8_9LILI|nr:homeobox-leucine zipper protein HOX19-like [Canna indica]
METDACDVGLALGLGVGGRRSSSSNPRRPHKQPSLTFSLSDDALPRQAAARPSSPHSSTVSSFSTAYTCTDPSTIKKEKEYFAAGSEEGEVDRIGSRRGNDDDNDGGCRKKLRLTKEQSAMLEDRFKEHSTLNPKQKHTLAKQLNLRPRQVEVWFQNRRARTKLKQTEVDCEFLKRCCESLTDENRRLQKELQELKSLKFAPPPVYIQFPAATLTMCPSCKTIGGGTDSSNGGGAEPFVVTPKPHFYNPFVHSATC